MFEVNASSRERHATVNGAYNVKPFLTLISGAFELDASSRTATTLLHNNTGQLRHIKASSCTSAAMNWQSTNDVDALKALIAAQQQQLLQLQTQQDAEGHAGGRNKRRMATQHALQDASDDDNMLSKSDDDWDPADDSDYDDAPKKKRSSSKKKAGASSKKQRCSSDDEDTDLQLGPSGKDIKAAATLLRSIRSAINQQMVYRPSLKYGKSRVSLELPCLTEPVVVAMLGPQLMAKTKNGSKQLQLKASNDDLCLLYADCYCPFYKSLRYGATLQLIDGLTFTFNKAAGALKVHGTYTMVK